MTKMAGVTHAKTLFAKNPVFALLNGNLDFFQSLGPLGLGTSDQTVSVMTLQFED